MIAQEKWKISTPLLNLPNNAGNLGKIYVPQTLKSSPKCNKLPHLVTLATTDTLEESRDCFVVCIEAKTKTKQKNVWAPKRTKSLSTLFKNFGLEKVFRLFVLFIVAQISVQETIWWEALLKPLEANNRLQIDGKWRLNVFDEKNEAA